MTHNGHRERLRKRFIKAPHSFEDHELLELLLFYSMPRVNTNEIAHALLDRFGSLKGVIDAGIPSLMGVEKVGAQSALYIRVIAEVLYRYKIAVVECANPLESPAAFGDYLRSLFVGTENEMTYLLLFNNSKKLIKCAMLSEGYCSASTISMREMSSLAIDTNAAYAILAHNHPHGKAIPSGEDLATTNIVSTVMKYHGVELIDHFIVADDTCMPIINASKAKLYNQ